MVLDDVRKALESMIGLTPAKAQELAKRYLEPGAAKDQVSKTAGDLFRLSAAPARRDPEGGHRADEDDGRGDAGRPRRPPQARPEPGAGRGSAPRPGGGAPRGRPTKKATTRATSTTPTTPSSGSPDGRGPVGRRPLDAELVRRGLVGTPAEARRAIEGGQVTVGGAPATKATTLVAPDDALVVRGPARPFVSRGGEKLAAALDAFGVDPAGRDALDAGASTGGFTDCLLRRGPATCSRSTSATASSPGGSGRIPRVTVMDRTNVRDLDAGSSRINRPSLVSGPLVRLARARARAARVRGGDLGATSWC